MFGIFQPLQKNHVCHNFRPHGIEQVETIMVNKAPSFGLEYLLDFGPVCCRLSRASYCDSYSKNTLCPETPELCCGRFCHGKLRNFALRNSQTRVFKLRRKSARTIRANCSTELFIYVGVLGVSFAGELFLLTALRQASESICGKSERLICNAGSMRISICIAGLEDCLPVLSRTQNWNS